MTSCIKIGSNVHIAKFSLYSVCSYLPLAVVGKVPHTQLKCFFQEGICVVACDSGLYMLHHRSHTVVSFWHMCSSIFCDTEWGS